MESEFIEGYSQGYDWQRVSSGLGKGLILIKLQAST